MLGVLGEAALRTVLLAATVQLVVWVLRIRRAQLLLITWTVVLAASLAMPALQWATPLRLPIGLGHPAAWLISQSDLQQQAIPAVSSRPISAVNVQGLPAIASWLEAAYLLVSTIMVLRLVVGVALSLHLLSKASPTHLTSEPGAHIRISRAVAAPVTVGNVILLPPDVVDWPPAMCQAAIAHECAHVARGDFALLVLSQLNRALFWFSPVSWLLHRRLAALAELASDDHAMMVTGDRTGYAEVLLEMGRRSGPLLRGLAMARASTLQYRIERVLADSAEIFPVSGFQRSMIVVGAALVSVAAASPDLNPGAPSSAVARDRLRPALAFSDDTSPVPARTVTAVARPSPVAAPIEDPAPSAPATTLLPQETRVVSQQASGVQLAARPVSRPVVSTVRPPARSVQVRSRPNDTQGDVVAWRTVLAPHSSRGLPGFIEDAHHSNTPGSTGEVRYGIASQREGQSPLVEPSPLKVFDQQTCDGVYLPGSIGGAQSGNGWAALNVMKAKFFRQANGMPWLKLYLGMRDPVDLPVTVTGKEVEFTAAYNTSFKMLPQGLNHLTGTTERPSGTIDFACR